MHVAAAETFRIDVFAGCGFHQRRTAEEDGSLIAHDDRFVAHRRHVRAAGGARPHHQRDLRNAARRHIGLVVEDAAEVILVGKYLFLHRQERAARIDHVDAWQVILERDLLRPQMLLHRHRIVGTAFHRRVVDDDDAFAPGDAADAGDDAGRRHDVGIQFVCGELARFEECGARIDQPFEPLARKKFAAFDVTRARSLVAAERHFRDQLAQLGAQFPVMRIVGAKARSVGVNLRSENCHVTSARRSDRPRRWRR